MDLNMTIGIPIGALFLMGNLAVNLVRFSHEKKNGINTKTLEDLQEGQKLCFQCFRDIQESNVKGEVHLETIVQQLQILNSNISSWRK